ncbi:hypothetical protein ACFE04_003796 [Oxalis oulophora]
MPFLHVTERKINRDHNCLETENKVQEVLAAAYLFESEQGWEIAYVKILCESGQKVKFSSSHEFENPTHFLHPWMPEGTRSLKRCSGINVEDNHSSPPFLCFVGS